MLNDPTLLVNDLIWHALAQDAVDLAAFKERAREPKLRLEGVLKDLKKRDRL